MNDKGQATSRLGCANVVADSSLFTEESLEYKKESEFSRYFYIYGAILISRLVSLLKLIEAAGKTDHLQASLYATDRCFALSETVWKAFETAAVRFKVRS